MSFGFSIGLVILFLTIIVKIVIMPLTYKNYMSTAKTKVIKPEMNKIYKGKVIKIMDFGAFVNFLGKQDGLVHISQIAEERVANVSDYLEVGQDVKVKCLDVDNRGRIKLSIKEANAELSAQSDNAAEETPAEAASNANADLTPNATINLDASAEKEKAE